MPRTMTRVAAVFMLLFAASCAEFKNPPDLSRHLVKASIGTVERFRANKDFPQFVPMLDKARAVMVFPSLIKAGFVGAAEGGSGVLLARREDGTWTSPAFYTLAAGSIGLQIGIQDTEMVMIIRNRGALESILTHQGKLGADLGITVGTLGAGAEAATTTNLGADIVAYVNANIGVFGGASLEGTALARRHDLNQAYYGQAVEPRDIVIAGSVTNPDADSLRAALGPGR